jgi:hypothetical protein
VSIRYLKITLVDGTRFILRVTSEASKFVHGFEVNAEGDEIVPAGYDRRHRTIAGTARSSACSSRRPSRCA